MRSCLSFPGLVVVVVLREIHWSHDFVLSDEGFSVVQVPFGFPGVFHSRVPFPLNKESVTTGFSAVSDDRFYFVFLISIN